MGNKIIMKEVLVKHFKFRSEADLAKGLLEKYGIKSVIQFGLLFGNNVRPNNPADLFVSEKNLDKAKEILGEHKK